MKKILMLATMLFAFSGCAVAASPVTGLIYTDAKAGGALSDHTGTDKFGSSCATSILGLVGTGDASIAAAARDGNITKVSYVDTHTTSVLGIFAKYCTEVRGE